MNRSKKICGIYYVRHYLKTAIITVFHIYSPHHCLELHNCDHYQSSRWGNLPARGSHRDLCRLEVSLLCWRSCYWCNWPVHHSSRPRSIMKISRHLIHHSSFSSFCPHCEITSLTRDQITKQNHGGELQKEEVP